MSTFEKGDRVEIVESPLSFIVNPAAMGQIGTITGERFDVSGGRLPDEYIAWIVEGLDGVSSLGHGDGIQAVLAESLRKVTA